MRRPLLCWLGLHRWLDVPVPAGHFSVFTPIASGCPKCGRVRVFNIGGFHQFYNALPSDVERAAAAMAEADQKERERRVRWAEHPVQWDTVGVPPMSDRHNTPETP